MRFPRPALAGILTLALTACGRIDYDAAPEGQFTGSLFVMWIGEGGSAGDGTFVFVPNPRSPLTFVRGDGRPYGTIRPEMMYTDGGSIPRVAQVFRGFSPWGYAPAYMVHDWLFIARHCNIDGTPTEAERAMAGMPFQTSADIIAEAIKTLVDMEKISPNDVAPRAISSAVAGPLSREIWDRPDACEAARVSEDDRRAAELGIPGAVVPARAPDRTLPDGTTVPLQAAEIVGVLEF